jgi:pimeloyl-ACP methyl ester carboxylesterase
MLSLALLCCTELLPAQTANCDNTTIPTLTAPAGLVAPDTLLRESGCTPGAMGSRTPLILIHGLDGTSSIPPSSSDLTVFENLSLYLTQQDPSFSQNYKIFTYHYLSNEYTVSQIGAALETWLDYFRQSWDPYGEGDTPFDRDIVIIGHSMGGLVARALMNANTINAGAKTGQAAGERVIRAITLATPHHGTALVNSSKLCLRNQTPSYWPLVLGTLDLGWFGTDCYTDIAAPNRGDLLCDLYCANDIFSSTLSLYAGSDVNTWLNSLPSTYNDKVNAYYGVLGNYGDVPTYGADTTGLTVDGEMVTLAYELGEESLQPSNTAGLTAAELANFHELMQVVSVIHERIDSNNWSGDLTSVSNDGAVPDFSASFAGVTVAKRVSCVTSDHLDMLAGTGGLCTDQTTGLTGTLFQVLDADLESLNPVPSIAISGVSPSSITLVQGAGSQSVTVNLTRSNYTGSITLATSTLPSGVSANITQPGAVDSGSISLLAASNAALVSSQAITITASGSGVSSVTAAFSLTVNPPPDFSLSISPTSATVAAGGSATYTLTVTPVGGFNQQVSLSCAGAPSAATCSVSPASVTLDGADAAKTTVTVTTTARSHANPTRRRVPPWAVGPQAIPWFGWVLMLATLSSLAAMRGQRVRFSLTALAATALLMISWVACGGGGGTTTTPPSGTPAGAYTLTLTGTYTSSSPSLTHNTTVSLTVN